MSIETRIDGDPASLRAVAGWLRDTLADQVSNSADDLAKVKTLAESGWEGEAGVSFTNKVRKVLPKVDEIAAAAGRYAAELDTLAGQVQQAQADMATIRASAAAARLPVHDQIIEPPSDNDPDKMAAYNSAVQSADRVRKGEFLWGSVWTNMADDVRDKWFIVAGDLINGFVGAMIAKHGSLLLANGVRLSEDAAKALLEAKNAPAGTPRATVYRGVDWHRAQQLKSAELFDAAKKADRAGIRLGLKVGGGLAVAGIIYDLATGKDPEQAVVSGVAGFGASVGVGMAVGSVVPVVGTALGAVLGAVAGIFTSGAVDELYEGGLGIGGAVNAGLDAVGSVGKAIGSGVAYLWDSIF